MNIKKYLNIKSVVWFESTVIVLLIMLYVMKPETTTIVLEESSLGVIPRQVISKKYDLEDELKSFVEVYLFKRYNFSPQNAEYQIADSFKMSSKRVEDAIRKNITDNNLIKMVKREGISQSFIPKDIKFGRSGDILEVKVVGERLVTKNSVISSRDHVKLSFLLRFKQRDGINPYKFYIDGVKEEIIN